jgi:hypothetical protein
LKLKIGQIQRIPLPKIVFKDLAEQVAMNKLRYRALAIILTALLLPALLFATGANLSPGLLHYISSRWGYEELKHVQSWYQLIRMHESLSMPSSNARQNIKFQGSCNWQAYL